MQVVVAARPFVSMHWLKRTARLCLDLAGTLYALCRNISDPKWQALNVHACDAGTQCCGYLGSAGRGGKLPDTW